jgi:hypothetical protein
VIRILSRARRRRPALTLLDDVYADALDLAIGPGAQLAELVAQTEALVQEAEYVTAWTSDQQDHIREAVRLGLTYEQFMNRRAAAEQYVASPEYAEAADERRLAEYEAGYAAAYGEPNGSAEVV